MVIILKIVPRGTISDGIRVFLKYLFHVEQIFSKIECVNVPRGTNMFRYAEYVPRGTLEIFIKMKDANILDVVICFNMAVIVNF